MDAMVGNDTVMAQLAIHWAAAATARADARIRLGNISPRSTHTTGPHVAPKNTTNALAPTTATAPHDPLKSVTSPASSVIACEKATAISPSDTVMPVDPMSNSRRRPILSTSKIATIVTTMLVTDVMVDVTKAWLSSKPTDCHSVL